VQEVAAPVDAEHGRRMAQRRHLRHQRRFDVLARHEQLDGFDARSAGGVDQVLALAHEQALLLSLPPRVEQLPDQLELRVVGRRDHSE
jgi:hypothetical protein